MKKGFTLIEMVGSLVILSILALVAFPAILNMLNRSQGKIDSSVQEYVIGAAKEYVADHVNCFPRVSSYTYNTTECPSSKPRLGNQNLTVQLLISEGYITDKSINNQEDMKNDYVEVSLTAKKVYSYKYVVK